MGLLGWFVHKDKLKEPMWTSDVNCVTQNNSIVQLLVPLCVFQPLLRDIRQTSTERFVEPAVVRDVCGALALQYKHLTG